MTWVIKILKLVSVGGLLFSGYFVFAHIRTVLWFRDQVASPTLPEVRIASGSEFDWFTLWFLFVVFSLSLWFLIKNSNQQEEE